MHKNFAHIIQKYAFSNALFENKTLVVLSDS